VSFCVCSWRPRDSFHCDRTSRCESCQLGARDRSDDRILHNPSGDFRDSVRESVRLADVRGAEASPLPWGGSHRASHAAGDRRLIAGIGAELAKGAWERLDRRSRRASGQLGLSSKRWFKRAIVAPDLPSVFNPLR
jgi:hypothetical protein